MLTVEQVRFLDREMELIIMTSILPANYLGVVANMFEFEQQAHLNAFHFDIACGWYCSGLTADSFHRRFHNPHPNERAILDAISSFELTIQTSLRAGVLKRSITKLEFPTHAFNFLFNGKGTNVTHKPGKLYNRSDFNPLYFSSDAFTYYNKHGEGITVKFPSICTIMYVFLSSHTVA